jgi:hypothetical protein
MKLGARFRAPVGIVATIDSDPRKPSEKLSWSYFVGQFGSAVKVLSNSGFLVKLFRTFSS